jgi:hypothetical protein
VFLSKKEVKQTKFVASRARLKVSTEHIWPACRMLYMPALSENMALISSIKT